MIKLLLLTLTLLSSLYANKVIYSSYDKVPTRIVKGEIFTVTLKTLSTVKKFDDIKYKFSNYKGVIPLHQTPHRVRKGKYFYDTFYFLSTRKWAKLPDVKASLIAQRAFDSTTVVGSKLNVISLNPKDNYSNILANKFVLVDYKTTSYDNQHNIIVFSATAKNSQISAMKFTNVYKQGVESIKKSYYNSKITYFVVVDKKIENFTFSYFNLRKNKFALITIPIVVDDDSVTTQTDLKPKNQSKERLKMTIAAGASLIVFIFILWRKKYIYLLLLLVPLIYIAYLAVPAKEICIKKGVEIRLLPVHNGTIFETTSSQYRLLKEGSVKDFVKVKLKNDKIGWVRNEDICTF